MNTLLTEGLYALATSSTLARGLTVFFASYLGWFLIAGALVYAFARPRALTNFLIVSFTTLSAWALAALIQFAYYHPRPYLVLTGLAPLVAVARDNSFPSIHAALFFALGFGLYRLTPALGRWYLFGAIVIGAARVAAGVHWPSDVLAGAVLGGVVAYLGGVLVATFLRSRQFSRMR